MGYRERDVDYNGMVTNKSIVNMNKLEGEIKKIAGEAIKLYSMETQRAYIEDKKKENSLTKQYKGREIYELLQNIDDAADENKDCI